MRLIILFTYRNMIRKFKIIGIILYKIQIGPVLALHFYLIISILPCIMMAAWNLSNSRRPADYLYSSTSHQVDKYLYELLLMFMNNCVR